MTGNWKVNVSTKFPQPIATALSEMKDTLIGAEYTPIAYLGEQVVNGTNHAVLAEQTILTGKDTKNIVLLIFNVKPTQVGGATLVSIERIVEGNGFSVWIIWIRYLIRHLYLIHKQIVLVLLSLYLLTNKPC